MKLILATSLVVAAAVGMSTWFSQTSIRDLTAKQMAVRRASGEAAIQRESELVVQAVAKALAAPVATNVAEDINPVLEAALRDDTRIKWLVATEETGKRVGERARAGSVVPAPDQVTAYDHQLPPLSPAAPVVFAKLAGNDIVYAASIVLGDHPTGTLHMGVTTEALELELGRSLAESETRAHSVRNRVWMVSLLVLAIGIVLSALQAVQIARPIKQLTVQAGRIAGGDLHARVPENRNDELGALARTFNLMANEIQALLVEQAQKASLEREMSLARQVQQAMLPPHSLDQHGCLNLVGYCMPASSCGGDWWTYRKLSDGRMLIVVGDATGHGIHSAMIAATARGAVEALSGIDERLLTPDQCLRAIDSAIRQVGDHNVLMTAFSAVFESETGVLHYANAGQNFPYIVKLGMTRMLEDASIIAASGNPLGDRNIAVEIRKGSVQLRPGDLFVCFTDGLVERANREGKLFGDRRLRSAITGQSLGEPNALVQLRDRLVAANEQYANGVLADDDITLVLVQYDPPVMNQRDSMGRGAA